MSEFKAAWQVWSEGYVATGESARATHHGVWPGETFLEACQAWVDSLPEDNHKYYDKLNNSYWGCRLYPTETLARAMFG